MKLMNSAMMPVAGLYHCQEINFSAFVRLVKGAHAKGSLESFIGYPQNIELLKKWTGCDIALNRSQTVLEKEDVMIIMRLNYRPGANTKGQEVNEKDFEFFLVKYNA